jgi:hypothetical protein
VQLVEHLRGAEVVAVRQLDCIAVGLVDGCHDLWGDGDVSDYFVSCEVGGVPGE